MASPGNGFAEHTSTSTATSSTSSSTAFPTRPLASTSTSTSPGSSSSSASSQPQRDWSTTLRSLVSPTPPSTILADLAPHILQSHIIGSPHFSPRSSVSSIAASSSSIRSRLGLGWATSKPALQDSNSIYIREKVDDLLRLEVPVAPFDFSTQGTSSSSILRPGAQQRIEYIAPDAAVPLLRGFFATVPAASSARLERRRRRAGLGELALGLGDTKLGLKERGDQARGLLRDSPGALVDANRRKSGLRSRKRKSGRRSDVFLSLDPRSASDRRDSDLHAVEEEVEPAMTREELETDSQAVEEDMSNVAVRRALLIAQIAEVDGKIASLDAIRESLKQAMLGLREEELELEDELDGIRERVVALGEGGHGRVASTSSRRRKGPAFLPSEHDDLPNGVAFMSLTGHLAPITALDFSEPYGVAVTASFDESVRLWDLTTGEETGYLKGHQGAVKVLQVESSMCVTGGLDGQIRIWDLDAAEAQFPTTRASASPGLEDVTSTLENVFLGRSRTEEDVFGGGDATLTNGSAPSEVLRHDRRDGMTEDTSERGACVKTLDGHTKAVTSLYFDGSCLVTGSSDSTLRQWDLQTGQCVLTMDILWAISNPISFDSLDPGDSTPASSPRKSLGALRRQSSNFLGSRSSPGFSASPTTTTYADGSFELYEDFVGGVQFWGYALASGTADGCVRMWDMRTGQAHRTLVGHTGPVTCVQFDEQHLVSGSLDKSIRIWDLRTGSVSDTIRYEHPITSLQFDSRKIVAAAGENGVRVFNRTTLQHTALTLNGHTRPAERLRFMDSYLMSGARDNTVKVWRM